MAENIEETNLQSFIRALYAAYDASRSVDYYALPSDNPASVQKWNGLLESQRIAFRELHGVCRRLPVEALTDNHE